MAKKQKEVVINEPQVVEQPKQKKVETKKPSWEIKDRTYILKGMLPLTFMLKSKNIYYFDEEKGYEREIKYCSNQQTVFVDEMKGDHRMAHITFVDGVLNVPKEKTVLQKLLSVYHPYNGDTYYELDNVKEAVDEVQNLELELDAMNMARDMDIDMAEAVLRVEVGSSVSKMSSKEIKRDLLIYAKNNPKLFLDLANDENVHLRNTGIKATEMGIIQLSPDQRVFSWSSNGRKLMNVPFDEHPYSALAAWFKTDEGMEILQNIEKQLS